MTKSTFSSPSWTPTVVADTATMTANGAMFLQGASATSFIRHSEFYLGGLATASTVNQMIVARDSTVAVTAITLGTNGKLTPMAVTSSVVAQIAGMSATTMPQRDTAKHLLQLGFNAFGGIVRWVAYPGEEITTYGLVATGSALGGELSISSAAGAGLLGTHWIHEPD